jgi:hypothetical protein
VEIAHGSGFPRSAMTIRAVKYRCKKGYQRKDANCHEKRDKKIAPDGCFSRFAHLVSPTSKSYFILLGSTPDNYRTSGFACPVCAF